jgi:hypothetical protein
MTETDQKAKLYTINQGVLATFLGGPLGGAIIIAQNYKQFGSPQSAKRAIVVGVLATCALVPIVLILPESTPNAVLPVAYSIAFRLLAERLQGAELKLRIEAGTERQSWWRTLGVSVVTALCTGLVLFGGLLGITTLFPSL